MIFDMLHLPGHDIYHVNSRTFFKVLLAITDA